MRSEVVTDWQGLRKLEAEWNGLLERSKANTIFLRWEWIQQWGDIVASRVRPCIVIVRDNHGRVVGIAPFYVRNARLMSFASYRILGIMGDDFTGAEYSDWLVSQDNTGAALEAISDELCGGKIKWDCIWMPRMAGWTGARERIIEACEGAGFNHRIRPRDFAFVRLPNDIETFKRSLSKNRREQIRRQGKKVMRHSGVAVTRCLTEDDLPRYLDALFELHHLRWVQLGQRGAFEKRPLMVSFYRQFAREAIRKRWLWLYGLEVDGRMKAVQVGYVYNRVYFQMQEGFDPDFLDGVGNVLRIKVIEDCISAGVEVYDFLGEMTEHKRRWLAERRAGYDVLIGRRSLKNRVIFSGGIWPTGRFMQWKNGNPSPG